MLLEFLPHLTRLIPAADKYLNSRQASDKAHEAALVSLTDELRGGFAKTAEQQTTLRSDLQQHAAALGKVSAEIAQVRSATDTLESRLAAMERKLAFASRALWAALALLAGVLVLLLILLLRK